MSRKRITWLSVIAITGVFLYYLYGGSSAPAGQPPLVQLSSSNLASLKDAFNGSASSVRVLVLVSPT